MCPWSVLDFIFALFGRLYLDFWNLCFNFLLFLIIFLDNLLGFFFSFHFNSFDFFRFGIRCLSLYRLDFISFTLLHFFLFWFLSNLLWLLKNFLIKPWLRNTTIIAKFALPWEPKSDLSISTLLRVRTMDRVHSP